MAEHLPTSAIVAEILTRPEQERREAFRTLGETHMSDYYEI